MAFYTAIHVQFLRDECDYKADRFRLISIDKPIILVGYEGRLFEIALYAITDAFADDQSIRKLNR